MPAAAALKGGVIFSSDPTSNVYLVTSDDSGNVQITYKPTTDGQNSYSLVNTTGEVFTVVNNATDNIISLDLDGKYKVTAKTFDPNGKPTTYELTGTGVTPITFAASALTPKPTVLAAARPAMLLNISSACPSDELTDENLESGQFIRAYVCRVAAGVPDSQAVNRLLDVATNAGASIYNGFVNLGRNFINAGENVASHISQVVRRNNEIIGDTRSNSSEKLMILKLETGFTIGEKLPSTTESNRDSLLGLAKAARDQSIVKREDHLGENLVYNPGTDGFFLKRPPVPATAPNTCNYPNVLQAGVCYSNCTRPASGGLVCDTPRAISCTLPKVQKDGMCVTPVLTCTLPKVLQGGVCVTPTPITDTPFAAAYKVCRQSFTKDDGIYGIDYCYAYATAVDAGKTPTQANQAGAAAAGSNVGNIGMGQPISATGTPSSSSSGTAVSSYETAYNTCHKGTPAMYNDAYCTAYANAIVAGSSPTVANQKGATAAGSNVGNIGTGQPVSATGTPASGSSGSTTPAPTYQSAYDACYNDTPSMYTETYCAAYATAIAASKTPTQANQAGAAAAGSNVGNIGTGQPVSATGTPGSSGSSGPSYPDQGCNDGWYHVAGRPSCSRSL